MVFVLLPLGCGVWVMIVRNDETIVVCWPLGPTLTVESTVVAVMTTGRELFPPPDWEETEFPFPEEPLD